MIRRVLHGIEDRLKASSLYNQEAYEELRRETARRDFLVKDNRFHIMEAVEWIKRAQDATPDRGVSRAYSAAWHPFFRARGWQRSYPETTGYIIPTFLEAARYLDDPDLAARALAMADWEIDVQLPNGAVMGGVLNEEPTPAVFNTGQVILGWVAAYQQSGSEKYLQAAKRAGEYLLQVQQPDGGWVKGNSEFADPTSTTYNSRVGWALIVLGQCSKERSFCEGGERNIRFSLAQQDANGWFRNNCLTDSSAPLLHTISYAIEGIWGAGELLDRPEYLDRAKLSATKLMEHIREDGSVPGRLDKEWQGTVSWSCLTGDAQLAGIWLRAHLKGGDPRFLESARRVLTFLKATQNCVSRNGGLRGGIKGSHPFDGDYGRFEVLNWATKFYLDALLLDEQVGAVTSASHQSV
ncbi:hypothetical protein YTPLAS18_24230 [Nitrospira sp.]|nr:hypothetical protein YTPLAS18_24230 [Nitrospira sp.]